MKVTETNKSVIGGAIRSVDQRISLEHMDMATAMFRDRIYNDKKKACFVETTSNAFDEHRKYNVKRPVDILISTKEICIRDFGQGLSEDETLNTFFQFFKSTKNKDNVSIGGFGFGAKAPGAYSKTYFVESFFKGEKKVYMSVPDGFKSIANLISIEKSDLPSGICVRVPVKQTSDAVQFLYCALDIYRMIGLNTDPNVDEMRILCAPRREYLYDWYCENINNEAELNDPKYNVLKWTEYTDKSMSSKDGGDSCSIYLRSSIVPFKRIKPQDKNVFTDSFAKRNIAYGNSFIRVSDLFMLVQKDVFYYSFYKDSTALAYDGDLMYKLPVSTELFKKYFNNIPYSSIPVIMFKRGELTVSPSRESIEQSEVLNKFVESKLKEAARQIEDAYKEAFKTLLEDKDLAFNYLVSMAHERFVSSLCASYDSTYRNLYSMRVPTTTTYIVSVFKKKGDNGVETIDFSPESIKKDIWSSYGSADTVDRFDNSASIPFDEKKKMLNNFIIVNDSDKRHSAKNIIRAFIDYLDKNGFKDKIFPATATSTKLYIFIQRNIQSGTSTFEVDYTSYPATQYKTAVLDFFVNKVNTEFKKNYGITRDMFVKDKHYFNLTDIEPFIPKVTRKSYTGTRINSKDLATYMAQPFYISDRRGSRVSLKTIYDQGNIADCKFATVKEYDELASKFSTYLKIDELHKNIGYTDIRKFLMPNYYLCSQQVLKTALKLGASEFTVFDIFKTVKKILVDYKVKARPEILVSLANIADVNIKTLTDTITFAELNNQMYMKDVLGPGYYTSTYTHLIEVLHEIIARFNRTDKSVYDFRKDITEDFFKEYTSIEVNKTVTPAVHAAVDKLFDDNPMDKIIVMSKGHFKTQPGSLFLTNVEDTYYNKLYQQKLTQYKDKLINIIKDNL